MRKALMAISFLLISCTYPMRFVKWADNSEKSETKMWACQEDDTENYALLQCIDIKLFLMLLQQAQLEREHEQRKGESSM